MTAATATKTTAKSGAKKTATAKQSIARPAIAASETKATAPTGKPEVAKPTTSAKPAPTAKIAAYIESLTTPEERRFAAKQWRRVAGHRATEPSLRGVTPERAKSIREGIAAALA